MKKLLIILFFLLLPSMSLAEIKYNPYSGQWESAPRDSFKIQPLGKRMDMKEMIHSLNTTLGLANGNTKDK